MTAARFLLVGLSAVAVLSGPVPEAEPDWTEVSSAVCETDDECARFCPVDDPSCDGGPD
jgi:hypothetical protein